MAQPFARTVDGGGVLVGTYLTENYPVGSLTHSNNQCWSCVSLSWSPKMRFPSWLGCNVHEKSLYEDIHKRQQKKTPKRMLVWPPGEKSINDSQDSIFGLESAKSVFVRFGQFIPAGFCLMPSRASLARVVVRWFRWALWTNVNCAH